MDYQIGMGKGKFWGVRPQGWKASTTGPGAKCLIVGRPGIEGCATVVAIREGLSVALRTDMTPEQCAEVLRSGKRLGEPDAYLSLKNKPGVGDYIVEMIEQFSLVRS